MNKIYINFSSITFALKTEKILNKNNIYCKVVRTPSQFSPRGCGYSILIDKSDINYVLNIIKTNSIPIDGIYS